MYRLWPIIVDLALYVPEAQAARVVTALACARNSDILLLKQKEEIAKLLEEVTLLRKQLVEARLEACVE